MAKTLYIPVAIIGDGILGTLMAYELTSKGVDVACFGSSVDQMKRSATYSNLSSMQSGILQAYSYGIEDFGLDGDAPGKADFLIRIKRGRENLGKISLKIADCIGREDGLLHLPCTEEAFQDHCRKVAILGYNATYQKKVDLEEAENLVGDFYREGDARDFYVKIPDRPFDLDLITYYLKDLVLQNRTGSEDGEAYFFDGAAAELVVQEVVEGGEAEYQIGGYEECTFVAKILIVCAGIESNKILGRIDPAYRHQAHARGFCINKSPIVPMFKMGVPFFSRLDRTQHNYINICKHGNENVMHFDAIVVSTEKDFRLRNFGADAGYESIRDEYRETIKAHHDSIAERVLQNIGSVHKEGYGIEKYTPSFCVHFHGPEKYSSFEERIGESNIFVAHPGLATTAIVTAEKVCDEVRTLLAELSLPAEYFGKENARRLKMLSKKTVKYVKNWIKENR